MDDLVQCPPQPAGEGEMIGFELWTDVQVRARRGEARRKIARELGLDRKTVRRILAQERPQPYCRTKPRGSILEPYRAFLVRRVEEVDYNAHRLFLELTAQGYPGTYETIKRAVRPLRAERDRLAEATMRFETAPGRQAQVDWATVRAWIAGTHRRVHMFAMVLGYSRCQYFEFTEDERLPTLLACHEHAFDWFGGLTEEILYDNPKTVVLDRDLSGQRIVWHPQFWDFAQYYGFAPRLCAPRRPQTKGKIEAGIKYGKRSFVLGGQFASLADLNEQARHWIRTVADQRVHGTTFERPADRVGTERLRPHHGQPRYLLLPTPGRRTVATDCLVTVETNRYSVPPPYVGRSVEVRWGHGGTVQLWHEGVLIATHARAEGQHQCVVDPAHYQALRRRPAPGSVVESAPPSLALTAWKGPFPDVTVRPLTWYEALSEESLTSAEQISHALALGAAIGSGGDPEVGGVRQEVAP